MQERTPRALECLKEDVERVVSEKGLDFHLLYGNMGVLCDEKNREVRYVIYARAEDPSVSKISRICPMGRENDLGLVKELRKIEYKDGKRKIQ